jgi:hypothetical protein
VKPGSKFDDGRAPLDLLDPVFEEEVAWALAAGAKKYAAWNHLGGFSTTRIVASVKRHVNLYMRGEEHDPDASEHAGRPVSHLACAAAQLQFLMRQMSDPDKYGHLDDRPDFAGVEVKKEDVRWKSRS